MFGPLVRHQAGDAHYAAFRRGVRRHADPALERKHRGDVDNFAAVTLSDKVLRRSLRHKEHALNVQVHHVVPVFFAEVDRIITTDKTCVVDQNIDMTEFCNCALQQRRNAVNLTQVGGQT